MARHLARFQCECEKRETKPAIDAPKCCNRETKRNILYLFLRRFASMNQESTRERIEYSVLVGRICVCINFVRSSTLNHHLIVAVRCAAIAHGFFAIGFVDVVVVCSKSHGSNGEKSHSRRLHQRTCFRVNAMATPCADETNTLSLFIDARVCGIWCLRRIIRTTESTISRANDRRRLMLNACSVQTL